MTLVSTNDKQESMSSVEEYASDKQESMSAYPLQFQLSNMMMR